MQELKLISHIYIINMQSVETSWPVDMAVFFQINARLWLKHALHTTAIYQTLLIQTCWIQKFFQMKQ